MKACALLAAALIMTEGLLASALADRGVDELYQSAEFVVLASVDRISATCPSGTCVNQYEISILVERYEKGDASELKSSASICSRIPLEINTTYVLFLEPPSKFSSPQKEECALFLAFDGAFEVDGESFYRVNSMDSRSVVKVHGLEMKTNAVRESGFRECLDGLRSGTKHAPGCAPARDKRNE